MTPNAIAKRNKAQAAKANKAQVVETKALVQIIAEPIFQPIAPVTATPVNAAEYEVALLAQANGQANKANNELALVVAPPVVHMTPMREKAIAGLDTCRDILVTTGQAWNSRHGEVFPIISHHDTTFPFNRFEYEETKFPDSRYSILRCSDTSHEVGVPFADSYFVFNNDKLKKWIDILFAGVERAGCKLKIKTCGTLKDRAWQFVSFEIEGLESINAGGREIRTLLSMLKSLDKQISFTLVNSTITVCCANTFAMVNGDTDAPLYAKIKLTKNCELKIDQVPQIVECFISGREALLKRLTEWHAIGINSTQAEQLFAAWLADAATPLSTRMGNVIERLKELHVRGKGNKGETALDAFNAVTEYYTHENAGKTDNLTKQVESSEIGDGAKAKGEFFSFLTKSLVSSDAFQGVCKMGDTILLAYNTAKRGAKAA